MRFLFNVIFIMLFTTITHSAENIVFGVASVLSPEGSITQYNELSQYIEKRIGNKISVVHKANYADMNSLIESGGVTFASVCTGALLYLPKGSFEILVVPVIDGKAIYKSYIIVNKSSKIKNMEELKGKRFAFTDPLSNSGTLYPQYLVKKLSGGKAEKYFSKVFYSQSHDKSVFLVNKGVVDGAAIDSIIYDNLAKNYPDAIKNVEIINISPEFTAPPFVITKYRSDEVFKSLQEILTSLDQNEDGKIILKSLGIDKFIAPTGAHSFENVLQMKIYLDE